MLPTLLSVLIACGPPEPVPEAHSAPTGWIVLLADAYPVPTAPALPEIGSAFQAAHCEPLAKLRYRAIHGDLTDAERGCLASRGADQDLTALLLLLDDANGRAEMETWAEIADYTLGLPGPTPPDTAYKRALLYRTPVAPKNAFTAGWAARALIAAEDVPNYPFAKKDSLYKHLVQALYRDQQLGHAHRATYAWARAREAEGKSESPCIHPKILNEWCSTAPPPVAVESAPPAR